MYIKNILVTFVIGAAILAPFSAFAATPTLTNEQILAEIQILVAQIKVLEAEIAALNGGTAVSSAQDTGTGGTLVVSSVPLLSGGTVHAGGTVPVSYLQITNVGKNPVTLTGFDLIENGSVPTSAVTALLTVDNTGTIRATSTMPFNGTTGVATTNVTFAAGQMRLFTVKATLANNLTLGQQLQLAVSGIETSATVKASLPIQGTTWVVGY
jgi:hypothetical protein